MKPFVNMIFLLCLMLLLLSCGDSTTTPFDNDIDPKKEIATDIELIYSDSAIVQYKLIAPIQESYEEDDKRYEEYPEGLFLEFYNKDGDVTSSMRSDYALWVSVEGIMTLRDSVVMINQQGDKLTTRGIEWNERDHTLRSSKLIQMVKASSKDTIYGYGFEAKEDFSQFKIVQATLKRKHEDLTGDVED